MRRRFEARIVLQIDEQFLDADLVHRRLQGPGFELGQRQEFPDQLVHAYALALDAFE